MSVPSSILDLDIISTNNFPQATDAVGATMYTMHQAHSSILKKQFTKGTNITVAASGVVTIPADNSYFQVGGTGFNVTGFSDNYNGRKITLVLPQGLTLVNSSSLRLANGVSRVTVGGEIATFINDSPGVWIEAAKFDVIDLTSYAGVDISLGVGMAAIYDVTASTGFALRIATGNNQIYEISIQTNFVSGVNQASVIYQPNNVNWTGQVTTSHLANTGAAATGTTLSAQNFCILSGGQTPMQIESRVHTRTQGKCVISNYQGWGTGSIFFNGTICSAITADITTPITSLGAVLFAAALTGRVMVKRIL